ncbi:hypothetical protein VTH06DRAFT_8575 [Thermothelomyces fergusii]
MCYIEKNIYTVCAHADAGDLVECERQRALVKRSEDGGFCANIQLALRSCRPSELSKLKYLFCPECLEHYRGYDTDSVDAVRNYWAYKALHGFSYSVAPQAVPGKVLAGLVPVPDDFARPRCELLALDRVWPQQPSERRRDWLRRLELARSVTLELAARRSAGMTGHETRNPVAEYAVHVQPQRPSPMSAYPYARVLSPIPEHNEEHEPAISAPVPSTLPQAGYGMGHSVKQIPLPLDRPPIRSLTARTRVKMDKTQDALLRRPLYLFDLPPEILDSLAPKPDAGLPALAEEDAPTKTTSSGEPIPGPSSSAENVLGSQACSLCGMAFVTVQEQKEHLKTDLHYYNLKQKMNGLKPVTEAEFEKLVEENDVSISGSETSDNEDDDGPDDESSRKESALSALLRKQASLAEKRGPDDGDQDDEPRTKRRGTGKPPLVWFTSPKLPDNHYFGIYCAMFTPEELDKEDAIVEAIRRRQLPPISMPKAPTDGTSVPPAYNGRHIFLCMMGGGHFAAMVVCLAPKQTKHGSTGPLNREAVVLAHKTFHRYTTRRKQGGSQSANDNAKGAAHSAGASLRRYNEQALVDDVRGLLRDWKALIDTSDLLFIRATGATNRRTLFGPYDGQVLRSNDPRIRGFPFSTRRATQNELMRSFIELTRLKVREIQPEAPPAPADETSNKASKPRPDAKPTAAPKRSEEEEAAIFHTTQIQRMRLERERRARAAEERIRRMKAGG